MTTLRIGYLLTLFPKLSESFVLNEVVHLQRRDLDILPISFDRSRRLEDKHHATTHDLRGRVVYVLDEFPVGHLRAFGYWLVRRPLPLLRLFMANARHPAPRGEKRLGRFSATVYTAWLVQRQGLTHLHAHWSYPGDIALLVADFLGVSFSITAHAHDIFEDIPLYEQEGFSFAERARRARFVVACTEFNRERLRALCHPEDQQRVYRAYHGLDVETFAPDPTVRRDQPPLLLSVGRFVPYKGFDVIVRACERLRGSGRDFRCVLAGPRGSQTEPVGRQIEEAGLTDVVEIIGPQTQEELLGLYRRATVYVNASNPDGEYGVANVIVEGLSTGLPTIATFRPQVTEYVEDGVNGLLVPYGDDAALAATLARVLDRPELRQRLATSGRATAVERFRIESAVDALEQLFRTVAAEGGATGSVRHRPEADRLR